MYVAYVALDLIAIDIRLTDTIIVENLTGLMSRLMAVSSGVVSQWLTSGQSSVDRRSDSGVSSH